ncbi:MAG: hypothetical protein QXE47_00580 [Candidatus Anstonellales archaeon]
MNRREFLILGALYSLSGCGLNYCGFVTAESKHISEIYKNFRRIEIITDSYRLVHSYQTSHDPIIRYRKDGEHFIAINNFFTLIYSQSCNNNLKKLDIRIDFEPKEVDINLFQNDRTLEELRLLDRFRKLIIVNSKVVGEFKMQELKDRIHERIILDNSDLKMEIRVIGYDYQVSFQDANTIHLLPKTLSPSEAASKYNNAEYLEFSKVPILVVEYLLIK